MNFEEEYENAELEILLLESEVADLKVENYILENNKYIECELYGLLDEKNEYIDSLEDKIIELSETLGNIIKFVKDNFKVYIKLDMDNDEDMSCMMYCKNKDCENCY